MMKNLCFCICLFNISSLFAQIQDFVNNPKNAWVATFTTDVRVDLFSDKKSDYAFIGDLEGTDGGLDILKMLETKNHRIKEGDAYMSNTLYFEAENSKFNIYSDSICSIQTTFNKIYPYTDTIKFFDSITREIKYRVSYNHIIPQDYLLFRVFQVASYQPEFGNWQIKVLSVTPLNAETNEEGRFIGWKPVFWMKVKSKKIDLNSQNITWAARTNPHYQKGILDINKALALKKMNTMMPMTHFFNAIKTNEKLPIYSAVDWFYKKKLALIDRKKRLENAAVGIGLSFTNDGQLKEEMFIENDNMYKLAIKPDKIHELRIVHEWAWDDKNKQLYINVLGIAPLMDIMNKEEAFLFKQPLFYIHYDD